MPKIQTFDTDGKPNGEVMPLWNELTDPGLRPAQVYATTILPGTRKGPHLHMERRGVFFCVSGRVLVRKVCEGRVSDKVIEPGGEYMFVPRGCPSALYNIGTETAIVINMPNPSWSKDNPDDNPVGAWVDPEDWRPAVLLTETQYIARLAVEQGANRFGDRIQKKTDEDTLQYRDDMTRMEEALDEAVNRG